MSFNATDAANAAKAAGFPGVFIDKSSPYGPYGSGWTIVRPGFKTDPSKIHNGGKAFFRQIAEAKAWAGDRYGVAKWVRIKSLEGSYFPAEAKSAIEAAMAEK